MAVPLNILIVEENESDVDIIVGVLRRYGGSPFYKRIDDIAALAIELDSRPWDLILCNYEVAQTSAVQILRVMRDAKARGIPFIIFYDSISEEDAANLISFGAQDCVPKRDFHRLMVAAKRGLDAAEARRKEGEIVNGGNTERFLLRQLMANMPDAIVFKDRDCRFTHVNKAACAIYELPEQEVIGRTRDEIIKFDRSDELTEVEERVLTTGEIDANRRQKMLLKDGSVRWSSSTRAPIRDDKGEIIGLMLISRNITESVQHEQERKTAAERFRRVLDLAGDAIIAFDENQHITVFNQGAEKIFGYEGTEVIGRPFKMLLPERFVAEHSMRLAEFGESCSETMELYGAGNVVCSRRKNGDEFSAEASISKYVEAGKVNYIVVLRDITMRRQLEEKLIQSQKMEGIGQLTGGIAHDFNNLLMVVIGNLDLLKSMAVTDQSANEIIDASLAAALNGADLAKSLLSFSRQQVLRPEHTDIGFLVGDHVKLLRRVVDANIHLEASFDNDIYPALVDSAQLRSALTNLVVNARDAMPSGGRLDVRAYNVDLSDDDVRGQERLRAGEFVVLEVSDTGCGISPELLQRIYDPFFTTKEVGKGTGLGLSMVYGFVKESRGMIDVSSEVGKGTVFKIFLPRTGVPAVQAPEAALKPAIARAAATILVVDDDLAVRKTVVAQLGSLGYKTIEAGAPAEALAILDRNESFDLLFTDIVMPGGFSGIDLARMARERRGELKVLLTSGFPDLKRQHGADEKNADVILSKPYRRSELEQAIGDMLAGVSPADARKGRWQADNHAPA